MVLLESDLLKIKILQTLNKSKNDLSMNSLRNKVGSVNYHSLQRNCEFLNKIEFIRIETKIVENQKYNFINITELGKKNLKKLEK